jgi:hypothetical protein
MACPTYGGRIAQDYNADFRSGKIINHFALPVDLGIAKDQG